MKYSEIRTFGTSYTQGGGFEYWLKPHVKKLYNGLSPMVDNTSFEFSWPGQLDKIVDCKVVDYAKCGHGNERLYRKVYEQVSDESFNKDEVLFLFEISSIGRKAIYSAEFKKWGIYNYQCDSNTGRLDLNEGTDGFAFDWNKEQWDDEKYRREMDWINRNKLIINQFHQLTIDEQNISNLLFQNLTMFLSFCDKMELNYYLVSDESWMLHNNPLLREWQNKFLFDDLWLKWNIQHGNGIDITEETGGVYEDGHNGFGGNIMIANTIAEYLLKRNEIDKIEEYKFPTQEEIIKVIKSNQLI